MTWLLGDDGVEFDESTAEPLRLQPGLPLALAKLRESMDDAAIGVSLNPRGGHLLEPVYRPFDALSNGKEDGEAPPRGQILPGKPEGPLIELGSADETAAVPLRL